MPVICNAFPIVYVIGGLVEYEFSDGPYLSLSDALMINAPKGHALYRLTVREFIRPEKEILMISDGDKWVDPGQGEFTALLKGQ